MEDAWTGREELQKGREEVWTGRESPTIPPLSLPFRYPFATLSPSCLFPASFGNFRLLAEAFQTFAGGSPKGGRGIGVEVGGVRG